LKGIFTKLRYIYQTVDRSSRNEPQHSEKPNFNM